MVVAATVDTADSTAAVRSVAAVVADSTAVHAAAVADIAN
jgi:hypothetical protein